MILYYIALFQKSAVITRL